MAVEYGRPQFYVRALGPLRLGAIAAFASLAVLLFGRKHRIPREGQLVVAITVAMALSTVFSPSKGIALEALRNFAIMIVAGPLVMMTTLDTVRKLRTAVGLYVVLGVVLALHGILGGGRGVGAFFDDENDLAMALCTVMALSYFLGVTARRLPVRLAWLVAFGVSAFGVVFSFSRGGFLGMLAVGAYALYHSPRRVAAALVIIVAVALLLPFVPTSWYDEMATIRTSAQEEDTGGLRLYMWGLAWKAFLDRPILGVGPKVFNRVAEDYHDPRKSIMGVHVWGRACHSLYFTMIAEVGLVGTILWLWLLIVSVRHVRRVAVGISADRVRKRDAAPAELDPERKALLGVCRGLTGAIFGFLVSGAFLTVNYYPTMWSLFGLAGAAGLAARCDPLVAPSPTRETGEGGS